MSGGGAGRLVSLTKPGRARQMPQPGGLRGHRFAAGVRPNVRAQVSHRRLTRGRWALTLRDSPRQRVSDAENIRCVHGWHYWH
jgi:hypothetical protein